MNESKTPENRQAADKHWADRAADEIVARGVDRPVVATGISPSGPFHVGHLREIITGDAVTRALRDAGRPAKLVFIVDNLDPLRKVYPFLDAERFTPFVGRSLNEVPAPEGEGTYDDYFLDPFLAALDKLRVDAEVVKASALYGDGRMDEVVLQALEGRDRLAEILTEVTGKEVAADWSPWMGRDPVSGRLGRVRVTGWDRDARIVRTLDPSTGEEIEQSISAGGKLTWRVDWPARWAALGVTVEPFGKDHASKGGSYDTGSLFAREIFGIEPPYPIVYEWIALAGAGDMSASVGNVVSVQEMLEVAPPEALRYMVLKNRPGRAFIFDPGRPLQRLIDEIDDASARGRDDRAITLSRAAGFRPVGVPFHHLVLVGQLADFDRDRVLEILHRGRFEDLDPDAVGARLELARGWLERFAPEDERVRVADALPPEAAALDAGQKAYLGQLAGAIEALPADADADAIHETLYGMAKAEGGPGAKPAFKAIYTALLGRDRGPRAASFIELLDRDLVVERFREASHA
jgi:lysyl-tRNA synthetase class 1